MAEVILELNNVHKSFDLGAESVEIIKGVNFKVYKGDFVILFGPSGCGKSTVLNMSLGLEVPTEGSIQFLGKDLYSYNEDQRADLRKKEVGMVYQQSNWVKSLNVIENVYFPLTLKSEPMEKRVSKAMEILKMVGMENSAYQTPTELSSGQQQRISLSRALITEPSLIIADEPTGNLDSITGEAIMTLFKELNQEGRTVIMVTHDLEYLKYATRSINMSDGLIIGEYKPDDEKLKKLSVSKRGNVAVNQSEVTEKEVAKEQAKNEDSKSVEKGQDKKAALKPNEEKSDDNNGPTSAEAEQDKKEMIEEKAKEALITGEPIDTDSDEFAGKTEDGFENVPTIVKDKKPKKKRSRKVK